MAMTIDKVQEIARSAEDTKARSDARGWLAARKIRCNICKLHIRGLSHWDGHHHKDAKAAQLRSDKR